MIYKSFIKPIAFKYTPERAHYLTVSSFRKVLSIPLLNNIIKGRFKLNDDKLSKEIFGLNFPNPIGLAAGFDKDGKYYDVMSHLGFGFIEIGTVTPLPQDGNPQPRLFRLPSDQGLINRMGFNNEGVDAMVKRLKNRKTNNLIIGGNIGKNKVTPNENAISDYEICFEKLYPYVDYFVVNVSSPNTPDLRALQDKEPLTKLLSHIMNLRAAKATKKPVLLKIAPDLSQGQLDDVLDIVKEVALNGIIATNTTIDRGGLNTDKNEVSSIGNGGLSGLPLRRKSLDIVKYIRTKNQGLPIIGVGGITEPQHALDMMEAGADLVQVYSGMVYYGPSLIKDVKKKLLRQ